MSFCVKKISSASSYPSSKYSSSRSPVPSMMRAFRSSQTVSTTPVPHRPTGVLSPMIPSFTLPVFMSISTDFTAPGILPVPQDMLPPSKAGPAAVDVTSIPFWLPIAISPLVPRSTSISTSSLLSIPHSQIPARISAPTYTDTPGSTNRTVSLQYRLPKTSQAGSLAVSSETAVKGARPKVSQEYPSSRCSIVVLPATAIFFTDEISSPCNSASCVIQLLISSTTRLLSSSALPLQAALILLMTSAPNLL